MLSSKQKEDTSRQLKENIEKAGVSLSQIAADLGTDPAYIEQLLNMRPDRIEDTWILRNYLIEKVKEAGKVPTKFTALGVDHHRIPFLDAEYIDGKRIS